MEIDAHLRERFDAAVKDLSKVHIGDDKVIALYDAVRVIMDVLAKVLPPPPPPEAKDDTAEKEPEHA